MFEKEILRILDIMVAKYPSLKNRRAAHDKQYACLKGELRMLPELNKELQSGIFQASKTYPCWIRLSSTSPWELAKGLSIKISVDAKTECDFFLVNTDVIPFCTNPDEFVIFFERAFIELKSDKKVALKYFFSSIKRFKLLVSIIWIAFKLKKEKKLLDIPYWSLQAYQFGDKACKFKAQPAGNQSTTDSPLEYTENLIEKLNHNDVVYDFMVQFQTDPKKMSVEDLSIPWREKDSPFQKIAELVIPKQEFNFPERIEFGNHLIFSLDNCLPENKPLGWVATFRNLMYLTLQKVRGESVGKQSDNNH